VRIEGTMVRTTRIESMDYFSSRPRESQLAAWASHQSTVLRNRQDLDDRYDAAADRYKGRAIDYPEHWGGYRIIPSMFEFWQERPHRLHDRIRYRKEGIVWIIERLSP
jgi:pyridoxamine 5'-phosphate oxidase